MVNWRKISRRSGAAYLVLAFALADAAAIYYAHNRLSQPWMAQAGAHDGGQPLIAEAAAPSVTIKDVWPAAPSVAVRIVPVAARGAEAGDSAVMRLAPVPAYRPLKLAIEDEAPPSLPLPLPQMAARGSGDGGLRIARMQRSREAARRFDSAFAVDIAQTAASELVIPRAEFGPDAAPSGEAPQPGAVSSNAGSFAPAEVNDSSVAANAPASPGAGIPAPDAGPGAELPALDADSAGGPSPG